METFLWLKVDNSSGSGCQQNNYQDILMHKNIEMKLLLSDLTDGSSDQGILGIVVEISYIYLIKTPTLSYSHSTLKGRFYGEISMSKHVS